MCCNVVQELGEGKCSGLCTLGLFCCKGAEGDEHGAVDGTSVVQEGSNNLLYLCDSVAVEMGTGIIHGGNWTGAPYCILVCQRGECSECVGIAC